MDRQKRITLAITSSQQYRSVNGTQIGILRQEMGISQQKFADICGWTQQYQSKIETPGIHDVSIDVANTIIGVLLGRN